MVGLKHKHADSLYHCFFLGQVESYSSQLFEVSTLRIEDLLQQLGSLGVSFSALALDSGSKWPFVTISSFQAQAMHFFEQQPSSTKNLHLSVLVSQAERAQWEAYSVEASPMWLAESYMQMGMRLPVAGTVVGLLPQVTPYIYQIEPENGTKVEAPTGDGIGYYAPNWMLSVTQPAARQLVNYNTLNDTTYMEIDSYLSEASENQSAPVVSTGPMDVFDEILLAGDEDDQLEEPPASPETTWPQSIIATALFDSFDEESRTRVATLSSQVFWHALFEGILSDESLKGPLILALEDSCGRSFMYEITESGVVYKGSASKPDLPSGQIVFSNTYEDLPLTVCNLTLHVSPSVEFSEASSTNQPAIYTVAVLGIFGIMGFFFCLYDRLTGKSYSEAISKVERSKSIVEAFFPQNVRDRLLNDKSTRSEAASKSGNSSRADDDDDLDDFLQKSRHGLNGKPIADLHPSVTVLFADIASFTVRVDPVCVDSVAIKLRHSSLISSSILPNHRHGPVFANLLRCFCFWKRSTTHLTSSVVVTRSSKSKLLETATLPSRVFLSFAMNTRLTWPALLRKLWYKCTRLLSSLRSRLDQKLQVCSQRFFQ